MRFLADAMLGKLAKWLRVMGHDCHYQSSYWPKELEGLIEQGRLLLTRHRVSFERYPRQAVFIHSDHVADQLHELQSAGKLAAGEAAWFSRCLVCNARLEKVEPEAAREFVPEYVLHAAAGEFSFCPGCRRFFWSGSHRRAMVRQLREWEFDLKAGR
jgi:hypothetical protein